MRVIKVYQHGLTMATVSLHARLPGLRGEVGGWSEASTRRNIAFLRSVDAARLIATVDGEYLESFAVTLTLKHCPPTSDQWHRLRRAFFDRLRRVGLYRLHWVTEWQRRGVPHLHIAAWFPKGVGKDLVIRHWLELAASYGAGRFGQYVLPITDVVGWFQYVAKHAARGVRHYQRSPDNVPPDWRMRTGRVWGKVGDWPIVPPDELVVSDDVFYRLRRMVRAWRVADARRPIDAIWCEFVDEPMIQRRLSVSANVRRSRKLSAAVSRLRAARGMLRSKNRSLADVRGVSEWVSHDLVLLMLDCIRANGFM